MSFPEIRMRDRRKDEATRIKHRQTPQISPRDLIMPVFVKEGVSVKKEIASMPGIFQLPLKKVASEAKKIFDAGVPAILLFGIPKHKNETGSASYDDKGVVHEAIRMVKKNVPGLSVIADVCMCEYTSHGHCGIIKGQGSRGKGQGYGKIGTVPQVGVDIRSGLSHFSQRQGYFIDNDETIKILARIAVSYADAGVDMVAPSAMMDGQVKAIKEALLRHNHPRTKIMSYSAKYSSHFYGPFRDAAESPPQFGDRKTYQMDYHNSDEAVLESKLDIEEGADILMVKPALGYEDIIYRIKKELKFPLACYSVSGEYSMIKAAAIKGYIDEKRIVFETLTGFKRAGADIIITYYAHEAAGWMKNRKQI